MSKIIFLAVIITVCNCQGLFSQKQGQALIDSLLTGLPKAKQDTNKVNLLIDLGQAMLDSYEYDQALEYSKNGLSLSEKLDFKKGKAAAYSVIARVYHSRGKYPEALTNYNSALKLQEETGDKKGVAGTYNNIGILYAFQDSTAEALKMYLAAAKINEAIGNKPWLANNYANMGLIYMGLGNYSEALQKSFAALKIYETIDDKQNTATSYNNIGLLYWKQKDYAGALKIYSQALKIIENNGDTMDMHHPYNNMAGIYADMGNYPEALKNYTLSLKIRERIGDKNLIADSYTGIGIVYQRMNNYTEAINKFNEALTLYTEAGNTYALAGIQASFGEIDLALKKFDEARNYFNKAMDIYKEGGDPTGYYYIYEDLAKVDSAAANYKSALKNYKIYIRYRDSSVNQENTKKLVQTQMQYDFEKKEAATKADQDKKDVITQEEAKRQRNIRNSSFAGLGGLLLFSLVVVRQRNKVKKEKKRSDELLLNILPAETAEELKATGTTKAKDFDEVTVLFTDFKNFTAMSEQLSAQELVNEIHYCYSAFDQIVSKYGIEKIKTIGDSYMCAGGLPVANKTNAEDTVKAALEIRDFMLNEKHRREAEERTFFEIRIGLHTGPVVAGIVGIKKFAYDIWGDTVNIASRMESSGEPGKINISGSTYELVKEKFNCSYRGKIHAKNKGEIDMYFVKANEHTEAN